MNMHLYAQFTGKTSFRSGTYSDKISITNSEFHLPVGSILLKGSGLRVQYFTLTNSVNHGQPPGSKGSYHDAVLNCDLEGIITEDLSEIHPSRTA
jgi:hypothetical protein